MFSDVFQEDEDDGSLRSSKRQALFQDLSCGTPDEFDKDIRVENPNLSIISDITSEEDDDIVLFSPDFFDDVSPDDVDSLLAQEMTQLSMGDREKSLL